MEKEIGFIGMGNMAQALATGFIKSGVLPGSSVYAYAPHQDKLKKNASLIGFVPIASIHELMNRCSIIIMACKPYQIDGILRSSESDLEGKALVSIAAGWTFETYRRKLPETVRIQCLMPNTPARVGEGILLFEETNSLTTEEHDWVLHLFRSVGLVEEIPSELMGIAGTITGCGPAFVDLMIEAYADVGVKYGLQRQLAYKLVTQTILGAAKLQKQTGLHPGVLKDAVCSPGGTTIRGVAALEENGFRNVCMKSIDAIMQK